MVATTITTLNISIKNIPRHSHFSPPCGGNFGFGIFTKRRVQNSSCSVVGAWKVEYNVQNVCSVPRGKQNNKNNETSSDSIGRVGNLKKTFVIDSSVLPVVNTGPITYTVMANSLRISKEFIKKFVLPSN